MGFVPSKCSTRCEWWQKKTTIVPRSYYSVVRLFICLVWKQFISSASVNILVLSCHTRAMEMSLCSTFITMEMTRAHMPLIRASMKESYFSSPGTLLHVKCPSSEDTHRSSQLSTYVTTKGKGAGLCNCATFIVHYYIALCLRLMEAAIQAVCASLKLSSVYKEKKFRL